MTAGWPAWSARTASTGSSWTSSNVNWPAGGRERPVIRRLVEGPHQLRVLRHGLEEGGPAHRAAVDPLAPDAAVRVLRERHVPLDAYAKATGRRKRPMTPWRRSGTGGKTCRRRFAVYRAEVPHCGQWGVDNKHAGFPSLRSYSPSSKDKPGDIADKWLRPRASPTTKSSGGTPRWACPTSRTAARCWTSTNCSARRRTWAGPVPEWRRRADIRRRHPGLPRRDRDRCLGPRRGKLVGPVPRHRRRVQRPLVRIKGRRVPAGTWVRPAAARTGSTVAAWTPAVTTRRRSTVPCKARLGRYIWSDQRAPRRDGA